MPSATPPAIATYQKKLAEANLPFVSIEIDQFGDLLSPGQCLFHGGLWPGGTTFKTIRPLSTTFCPQVALSNALWNGKAYNSGRIDLFVLRATNPTTKVFVFKQKGTNLGHEKEVLFAGGAQLTLVLDTPIQANFPVSKPNAPKKMVPVHVLEIEIS
jgi:hypothetical protein